MTSSKLLKQRAQELGTDGTAVNVFHQALEPDFFDEPQHHLPCDGTILCFEKINRSKMRSKDLSKPQWSDIKEQFKLDYKKPLLALQSKANILSIERFMMGPKVNCLTHAFGFGQQSVENVYSLYQNQEAKRFDYIQNALDYYAKLKEELIEKINRNQYTHLILGSTGWNNSQRDSFSSYHHWLQALQKEAEALGRPFKPYFFGLTWPSFWNLLPFRVMFDYFNKANDADEMGIMNINHLLWKVLMPAAKQANHQAKVMVISHSFGARILSRAVHSRLFFTDRDQLGYNFKNTQIDYFFIFQGAFHMKRYLPIKGRSFPVKWDESGVYAIDSPVKRTIATSSLYDKAVPVAFWSSHMGSKETLRRFNSREEYSYNKFDLLYSDAFGKINGSHGEKRFKLVIADEFIRQHSDVFDQQAATFMFQFLE